MKEVNKENLKEIKLTAPLKVGNEEFLKDDVLIIDTQGAQDEFYLPGIGRIIERQREV